MPKKELQVGIYIFILPRLLGGFNPDLSQLDAGCVAMAKNSDTTVTLS